MCVCAQGVGVGVHTRWRGGEVIYYSVLSSLFSVTLCRFVAAHFVGRRLIYPGSLAFFNALVSKYSE